MKSSFTFSGGQSLHASPSWLTSRVTKDLVLSKPQNVCFSVTISTNEKADVKLTLILLIAATVYFAFWSTKLNKCVLTFIHSFPNLHDVRDATRYQKRVLFMLLFIYMIWRFKQPSQPKSFLNYLLVFCFHTYLSC